MTLIEAIIDILEKYLDEECVTLYNPDKTYEEDLPNIYSGQYYFLQERLEEILTDILIIDTDSVRMVINEYLFGSAEQHRTKAFLDKLSHELTRLEAAWNCRSDISESILFVFRELLDAANCKYFQISSEDFNALTSRLNAVLAKYIGADFTKFREEFATYTENDSSDMSSCLEKLDNKVQLLLLPFMEEDIADTRYVLTSCINGQISVSEYKFLKAAREAMLKSMMENSSIDPMMIALMDHDNGENYSFVRNGWEASVKEAKTIPNVCHWKIDKLCSQNNASAVLVRSTNEGFTTQYFYSVTKARCEMRFDFRQTCRFSPETLVSFQKTTYAGNGFRFDENSAFCDGLHLVDAPVVWKILPITARDNDNSEKAGESLCGEPLRYAQKIVVEEEDLVDANLMVCNYSPDADCVPSPSQFAVPYCWNADFGSGWEMKVEVILPFTGMDAYAVATLLFNGNLMASSFRYSSVSGKWGLRSNGYLFCVNICPKPSEEHCPKDLSDTEKAILLTQADNIF